MKHNTTRNLNLQSSLQNEAGNEEVLTDFDYQMINEMKAIDGLKEWSNEQLKQYCLVLRTYTQIICHVTNKENSNDYKKEKQTKKLPAIVSNTFLYQNSNLKSKILA